jgi:hypothetical protein
MEPRVAQTGQRFGGTEPGQDPDLHRRTQPTQMVDDRVKQNTVADAARGDD